MSDATLSKIKFNFDQGAFGILYARHKVYVVPFFIIFVCIVVFFGLITHQIQDISLANAQVATARENIRILKENLSILERIDESAQNTQLEVVVNTLPLEKDFTGVLAAVSHVSSKTGISVSDYSFQVGDVTKIPAASTVSPLSINLTLQSDTRGTTRFLQELSRSVPLSNVTSVQTSSNLSTVNVGFYYRPLSFAKVDYHSPVRPLTADQSKMLEAVSSWHIDESEDIIVPISSPSGDESEDALNVP